MIRTLQTFITNNPKYAGLFLLVLSIISLGALFSFTPPIPQSMIYHQFADTRTLWGIPNFWNVISNIPFCLVSVVGFIALRKQHNSNHLATKETMVYFTLFLGVFFIGLGSTYYHLSPDNNSLVWDRIPMTIVFMSLLSLTIMKRINLNFGFSLFIPLIVCGVFSVLYWHHTELSGHGDLRLYGFVQFYTMLLILLILIFFQKPYPASQLYLGMFVFYGLAKITEHFDALIFVGSGGLISGHFLKHIFAAISIYFIVVILNSTPLTRPCNQP